MDPTVLAGLAAEHLDQSSFLIEIAAGYRNRALAAGFSAQAAEQMALDFHRSLLTQAFGNSDQ
jgi:hypothetical protein